MFEVSIEGKITITRGDSGVADLAIDAGTVESPLLYELQPDEEVHLYVYPRGVDYLKNSFLHKTFTCKDVENNLIALKFEPKDTINIIPGEYLYRVKCCKADGSNIQTVIDENTFIIKA